MLNPKEFHRILLEHGYEFFSGVPDSVLKEWINEINPCDKLIHIRSVNECESIALSAGHYLKTGKPAVSYMQNSGLCKAIDPLTSLCDKEVYSIPVLLLVGWRGEEGVKDEPQHSKMGKITLKLLKTLGINYTVLGEYSQEALNQIKYATEFLRKEKEPYALVIKKTIFEKKAITRYENNHKIIREAAIEKILEYTNNKDLVVATIGKTSRELYEVRENKKQDHSQDFCVIGSMGCVSSIGLGLAINSNRRTFILDGDGSALMQMGSFATIGSIKPKNFFHILFDNSAYESTGGQESISENLDFEQIAKSCGYIETKTILKIDGVTKELFSEKNGPVLYVIKVKNLSRSNLGRPKTSPSVNKNKFMDFIKNGK